MINLQYELRGQDSYCCCLNPQYKKSVGNVNQLYTFEQRNRNGEFVVYVLGFVFHQQMVH